MSEQEAATTDAGQPTRWESNAALLSFMLLVLSWELSVAMLVGQWKFGADWFDAHHGWWALGVSVALTIFHDRWGRRILQRNVKPAEMKRLELNAVQAVMVFILVVSAACFGTWLFWEGRWELIWSS